MSDSATATSGTALHGAYSHKGRRSTQEDRYEVCQFQTADGMDALLALVVDGIGGRSTGEMASHLAKEVIRESLKERSPSTSEIPGVLVSAFQEANQCIYNEALRNSSR